MIGSSTKYANTTRTIAGTLNLVFDNDVILLCDTSLGAVDLKLLEIPSGNFNTQYKLYVVDKSNNASVNNITINAPVGFTVNNSASAVININNGVAVVTISSNTTYNVQYNYGGSGGTAVAVKDEGVLLTPNVASLDFVGGSVSATAVGNDVTVTISPNFIILDFATFSTLVSANSLIPSQEYLITDAIFIQTVPEIPTTVTYPVVVEAITNNKVSECGFGIFLNADYQSSGDYSSVVGFVAQKGTWDLTEIYVAGDVCIYKNEHFVSLTGVSTIEPPSDPVNWSQLSRTSTNGYVTEVDCIKYDQNKNYITYREDIRGNKIDNNLQSYSNPTFKEAFYRFQWGNNNVYQNVVNNESYFSIWLNAKNSLFVGLIAQNIVTNFSGADWRGDNKGSFIENELNAETTLGVSRHENCDTSKNLFWNCNDLTLRNSSGATIRNNIFKYGVGCTVTNQDNALFEWNEIVQPDYPVDPYLIENGINGVFTKNRFVNFYKVIVKNNIHVIKNNTLTDNSYLSVANNSGIISENIFEESSYINLYDSTLPIPSSIKGFIANNVFTHSTLDCSVGGLDVSAQIIDNIVLGSSAIYVTDPDQLKGYINKNHLSNASTINVKNVSNGSPVGFSQNTLSQTIFACEYVNDKVFGNNFSGCFISTPSDIVKDFVENIWVTVQFTPTSFLTYLRRTNIVKAEFIGLPFDQSVEGGVIQNGIGTTKWVLDMNDPTIYDNVKGNLIIPLGLCTFFGYIGLINGVLKPINGIVNSSKRFPTRFTNDEIGTQINFYVLNSAILSATESLISDVLGAYPQNFRVDNQNQAVDYITVRRSDNDINQIEEYKHYL